MEIEWVDWVGFFLVGMVISTPHSFAKLANLYVFLKRHEKKLGILHMETNRLLEVKLHHIHAQDHALMPHEVWITPNGKVIYVSVDGTAQSPAAILVIRVIHINWTTRKAELSVQKVFDLEMVPVVCGTSPRLRHLRAHC